MSYEKIEYKYTKQLSPCTQFVKHFYYAARWCTIHVIIENYTVYRYLAGGGGGEREREIGGVLLQCLHYLCLLQD